MLGFVYISLSNKTGIVLGIVSNLQTGVVWTFKILFVVDDMEYSLGLALSSMLIFLCLLLL